MNSIAWQSGSHIRHFWDEVAHNASVGANPFNATWAAANPSFNLSELYRPVPIMAAYDALGWRTNGWIHYLSRGSPSLPLDVGSSPMSVVPATLLIITATIFNLIAAFSATALPSFDATDIGALILASGRGDLGDLDSSSSGVASEARLMRETKVFLDPRGGSSRLVMK